jgi:hypothetical protein
MEYKGINTKATGEKGNAAIADLGKRCGCGKFTPRPTEAAGWKKLGES